MAGCWVFGYGSLVCPASFGSTLGRELRLGVDLFEAELAGFGRRWNYGVMHTEGMTIEEDGAERAWTIVALGVVPAEGETVNGVVGWVDAAELPGLDRRERHYDRVDVTARVRTAGDPAGDLAGDLAGAVVTYVPRSDARRHYEAARDAGRAAVDRTYWDHVDAAFEALGQDRRARYRATTPEPDVPIVDLRRRPKPPAAPVALEHVFDQG